MQTRSTCPPTCFRCSSSASPWRRSLEPLASSSATSPARCCPSNTPRAHAHAHAHSHVRARTHTAHATTAARHAHHRQHLFPEKTAYSDAWTRVYHSGAVQHCEHSFPAGVLARARCERCRVWPFHHCSGVPTLSPQLFLVFVYLVLRVRSLQSLSISLALSSARALSLSPSPPRLP